MSPIARAGRTVRAHPRWSTGLAVVILAGAGIGAYFAVSSGDSKAAAATETVSTGTIRQSISASGTLAPAQDEQLNFSSSGVVTAVSVAEGQTVAKGQKLATINSASLAATVAQDQATVASDQAKVDDDQTNSASATQLAADQAALTAAQNQLTSAQSALAGATLTSPIAGVVAAVNLTVGQSVSGSSSSGASSGGSGSSGGSSSGASSSSSGTSSAQVEVISTNAWVTNASVDATSVGLIKVGNQAQLAVTGATSTVYGTISSIAVVSSSSSGTASYPVTIAVTGSPTGLHDGEDVTATLIYKQLTDVVVVPTIALHRNTTGGEYVEKLVNGKSVQTAVQVGATSGTDTQITSGLAAGDKIVVERAVPTRTGTGTTNRIGTNGTTGRTFGGTGGGGFGGAGGAGGAGGFGGAGGAGGFGGTGGGAGG
jgi:macrolide-specific efflux system membrane fusion protein